MEEGRVARFLKRPGQAFAADEPLLSVETDKATLDVEAADAGVMAKLLVEEGTLVRVGQPIALWVEPGEDWTKVEWSGGAAASSSPPAAPSSLPPSAPQTTTATTLKTHPAPVQQSDGGRLGHLRFPSVVRLLAQHNISAEQVTATGSGGQLLKADVLRHVQKHGSGPSPSAQVVQRAPDVVQGPMSLAYCQHEAKVGPVTRELLSVTSNGAGRLAASAAFRAGRMGLSGPTMLTVAGRDGVMQRVMLNGTEGVAAFAVCDMSASGVRGVGGLDEGVRALLTVGPLERRPVLSGNDGGIETIVGLSLAYDVAIPEQEAHALLLAVAREFKTPG